MRSIKLFFAAAVALFPLYASAAPCFPSSPFDDVPAGAAYCTSTEWLKNRSITLGCTSATMFCPNDAVTRASMALFLNRLGEALTPEVRQAEDAGAVDLDLNVPNSIYCQTSDFIVTGYPRRAQISTTFAGLASAALNYQHEIFYSTDGGATWTDTFTQVNRSGVAGNQWISSSLQHVMSLTVGVTYRWGMKIEREPTGVPSTADFSSTRCFNTVLIHHRNIPLF